MNDVIAIVKCGRSECDAAESGNCTEGHVPRESCPFYKILDESMSDDFDIDEADTIVAEELLGPPRIPLAAGEALSKNEVEKLQLRQSLTIVTVIGERNSGKTTFICMLYDRFLKGKFAGLTFAGSKTLIGFEKKSFHSRIDSELEKPDTQRTSYLDGLMYFHLSLARTDADNTKFELILSDRAGEKYQTARGNTIEAKALSELSTSTFVVILIDGERLAVPTERAGAMQSARQTIRAFLDAEMLGLHSHVQIVITKVDLLKDIEKNVEFSSLLAKFLEKLTKDFASRLKELTFHKIAARDPEGKIAPALGMDLLLQIWSIPEIALVQRAPLATEFRSQFEKLLLRTPLRELI